MTGMGNLHAFFEAMFGQTTAAICCLKRKRKAVIVTEEMIEGIAMIGLSLVESHGYTHEGNVIVKMADRPTYYLNTPEAAERMREAIGATERESVEVFGMKAAGPVERIQAVWFVPESSSRPAPDGSEEMKPQRSSSEAREE